jgi:xanthine dehydrogenase accessory factor
MITESTLNQLRKQRVKNVYERITELRRTAALALCTVVSTKGSTPGKAGSKMIVSEDGKVYGTIGGGALEKQVIRDALQGLKKKLPGLFRHDLGQLNMCCGGTVDVFIEPIMKQNKLYIFGAGHIGQSLCSIAVHLDFEVVLIDDRKEYLDDCTLAGVNKMNLPFPTALQALPFDTNTYTCILTYSHPADREILAFCLKKPGAYLGMIGSRRKVEMTRKIFSGAGISDPEALAKVDMPMGIDIHAESPEEIAISIMARIIQFKNNPPQ